MKILHFNDPVEFQENTRDFLLRLEAENNLPLGFQFCFLFTDLLNQTSNHIYQQVDYKAVCDVEQHEFLEKEKKDDS